MMIEALLHDIEESGLEIKHTVYDTGRFCDGDSAFVYFHGPILLSVSENKKCVWVYMENDAVPLHWPEVTHIEKDHEGLACNVWQVTEDRGSGQHLVYFKPIGTQQAFLQRHTALMLNTVKRLLDV